MCALPGSAKMKYRRYIPNTKPMNERIRKIFFRTGLVSINKTAMGTKTGHNTYANIRYRYVITVLNAGKPKDTQMTPSIICWMPNKSGMLARGSSAFVFAC